MRLITEIAGVFFRTVGLAAALGGAGLGFAFAAGADVGAEKSISCWSFLGADFLGKAISRQDAYSAPNLARR